ncbi:hypothetical protein FKM82_011592 [Ascaphus truei]
MMIIMACLSFLGLMSRCFYQSTLFLNLNQWISGLFSFCFVEIYNNAKAFDLVTLSILFVLCFIVYHVFLSFASFSPTTNSTKTYIVSWHVQ